MNALARNALFTSLLVGALLGSGGCVYRPNIQQGNLLKVEDIDQVTTGMTRSQVRYLLGTPMLADPFDPQRWDYIYTFRRGRESTVDRAHFIVRFEDDKVSRIEKPDMPELIKVNEKEDAATSKQLAKDREPPPPPSIKQPQPDAPRPGGTNNNNN